MRGRRLFFSLNLGLAALLAACGGHNPPPTIPLGTSTVSLTIHDTPPAGVAVLSFQISVIGVTLNPAVQGIGVPNSGSISLLDAPVNVELAQLVTDRAFLTSGSVPEGTYGTLTLTFANPRLTIQNTSGSAIGSCANGSTCELTPTLTIASAMYPISQAASSITLGIAPNTPVGLDIDFDLNQSLQSDLSINPIVTVTQLPKTVGPQGQQFFAEVDNLEGAVSDVNYVDRFALNMNNGQKLTLFLAKDNTVAYGFPVALDNGQTVRSNARLQLDGTLVATEIYFEQSTDEAKQRAEIVGTVASVDSPTQFHMVMNDALAPVSGIKVGNLVAVTIQGPTTFNIASDGLTLPLGLSFASSLDLMIGQEVQVSIAGSVTPTDVLTDQITLRMSQVPGMVSQTANTTAFTLGNVPALFTNSGITAMQGAVVSETAFDNLTGITLFQPIAVRGLLFNTAGTPTLVAGKISLRQVSPM